MSPPQTSASRKEPQPNVGLALIRTETKSLSLETLRTPDSDVSGLFSDLWNQDAASSASFVLYWQSPVWWVGNMWKPFPGQLCCISSPTDLL